jgi:hypothetical protein
VSGAQSYMTNGLLIYGEIFAHSSYTVLESMTLHPILSEFPYIEYEENLVFFYIRCTVETMNVILASFANRADKISRLPAPRPLLLDPWPLLKGQYMR